MVRAVVAGVVPIVGVIVACGSDGHDGETASTAAAAATTATRDEIPIDEAPRGPVPSIPAGTYVMTVSAADARRAGIPQHEIGENVGRFTLRLDAGRSFTVQKALTARRIRLARVRRHLFGTGDRVTFRFTTPEVFLGAEAELRWRVEGQSLVFSSTSATTSYGRALFASHPWERRP